jgi:hypothetical protein
MTLQLWLDYPDRYDRCDRCRGGGQVDCHHCNGRGSVVGPDWYMYAGRIGRRFGLKRCSSCHGSGKQRCGICISGSIRKAD